MAKDVANYIQSCDTCKSVKQRQSQLSLSQLVKLALQPRANIYMDFIVELQTKKSGDKNGVVVVDTFTKMTHFISLTKVDTTMTSIAFEKNIWRFYGLRESIVSGRVPQSVSGFWTAVSQRLGIRHSQ